jgi:hypothetical protein
MKCFLLCPTEFELKTLASFDPEKLSSDLSKPQSADDLYLPPSRRHKYGSAHLRSEFYAELTLSGEAMPDFEAYKGRDSFTDE